MFGTPISPMLSFSNVRRNRTTRVFTANEAPPEIEIFLQREMAQTLVFPGQLFFFEQAPTKGGATPIGRSDLALAALEQTRPDLWKTEELRRAVSQRHARVS